MFILRKCSNFTAQENQILGDNYRLVTYKDYKEFEELCNLLEEEFEKETENIAQFVIADGKVYPTYNNEDAFIMNENGKTFANITISRNEKL